MDSSEKIALIEYFRPLPDPRRKDHNKLRHELLDIVVISILAVICGADSWIEIEVFGKEKESWLKTFLSLPNGIPSHDTFGRIFSLIDPSAFDRCFLGWVKTIRRRIPKEVVAIDGKSVRRSYQDELRPLHLVNAFATENGIVIGQKKVDGKSNEITAIPELLKLLDIEGCIVTTDAMGCQCWITMKIAEQKADYALAVKGNQRRLLTDITRHFSEVEAATTTDIGYARTSEHGHGREEVRECRVSTVGCVRDKGRWQNLRSIAKVTCTRIINGKTSTESRYFISSLEPDAVEMLRVVRAHWKVETSLHWSLDISFREDESRIRIGHAQENLALIRKLALNLLRNEKTSRSGIKARRLQAGWSEEYLLRVLEGGK